MIPRSVRLVLAVAASLAALHAQTPTAPAGAAPAPAATAAATVAKPGDEIINELKLPDADIDTVLGALEIYTGRTVLRPASLPTATYNLKITKPIPKSEAVLAIETVLALNGVGVAPQGDRFLVVTPLSLTRTSAPEMITGSAFDQPPSGKPATKVFQLDFLRAQEFAQMITPLQNPNYGGGLVQLPSANALLITDSVANLQRIEALLQQVDKPTLSGVKPKFYPLKYTKASDVVSKMRTILQSFQQQLGQATSYSADDTGAQVIVVTDERQLPLFDELIDRLDVKSNPFTKNDVIYLKHADAKDVGTLLTQLISGQTGAAQRSSSGSLRPGQGVNGPTPNPAIPTPPVPGAPIPPTTVSSAIESAVGGTGSTEFSTLVTVVPDLRSNAIVVSGTADDIALVKQIVDKLDIILAQVRIEVVLAEVNLDDNHTSGISQLGFTVAGDKITGFAGTEASSSIANGVVTYRGGTTPVSGPFDLAAALQINTTPRKSDTVILSKPAITTTHNKEAKFFFGETRPVVNGVTSTPTGVATGATTGFSTNSQINQQEIGTTITVTPLIGNDLSVQLKIAMDISDVTNTVQIDNNTQYVIGKRTTNSFITAKSGDILYLSGMQKTKDSRSTSRLGPIPFIGDLFGTRNKDNQRTELIFFFRPTVLTNTPADNAEAMNRINALQQRDEVMKVVNPAYQPPTKKSFIEKVFGK